MCGPRKGQRKNDGEVSTLLLRDSQRTGEKREKERERRVTMTWYDKTRGIEPTKDYIKPTWKVNGTSIHPILHGAIEAS